MDKQVQSEKERLAARIAELEARLSSVRTGQEGIRATDDAVQTYGDYLWNKDDAAHTVSQADIEAAVVDRGILAADEKATLTNIFKYAMSPDERRRPNDMQATSLAGDAGKRVLDKYQEVFKARKGPNAADATGVQQWVETVGKNSETELSTFHDWQAKVFEDGSDDHNKSLSSSEIEEHLKVWISLKTELEAEADEAIQKAHIDELTKIIDLGDTKTDITASTLIDSKSLLKSLIKNMSFKR